MILSQTTMTTFLRVCNWLGISPTEFFEDSMEEGVLPLDEEILGLVTQLGNPTLTAMVEAGLETAGGEA